jgi:hypothetical protein
MGRHPITSEPLGQQVGGCKKMLVVFLSLVPALKKHDALNSLEK